MSCLLPQFKCHPDTFRTHPYALPTHLSKAKPNLCFQPQCILSASSPPTPTLLNLEKKLALDAPSDRNKPWPYIAPVHSSAQRPKCKGSDPSSLLSSSNSNYRPVVILPGLGNNSGDYHKLKQTLKEKYDVASVVAKVSRVDWLRNAAGLVDPNYWRGTLGPRPVLDWYLNRVHDAVQQAIDIAKEPLSVSLIGHSAGGWLARIYMQEFGTSHIPLLLTLGTPHLPPPKGVPGVIDQTRGILDYVHKYCSEPIYTPQLKYVCIAGRYIEGARLFGKSNPNIEALVPSSNTSEAAIINTATTSPPNPTLRARFVGQGYKQVCGQADVWGDGVVPQVSAHLEGALNICLDGVYHSPVGSDDATRPWYGSPHVLEQWVEHLLN